MDKDRHDQQIKEITEQLEKGIQSIFTSGDYREYLQLMGRFHDYSLNNTVLIHLQCPDATYVAGFKTWQDKFDRHVDRHARSIKIIAPSPFKAMKEQIKTDASGNQIIGADGKPETETTEVIIPSYRVVNVFDVSQTSGKELPSLTHMLTGTVEGYQELFETLKDISPAPVSVEAIAGRANGYYQPETNRIVVRPLPEEQSIKTTIHEIAHALLHNKESDPDLDRITKEIQAESVAYTVCSYYGIDTSDYSLGYVAGWAGDKDFKELRESIEIIRRTASDLINSIDARLEERKLEREDRSRDKESLQQMEITLHDDRHIHHGRG